ncbi:hypothetical protein ThrDRAFT_02746 [Frankia casuarinae]|nr:hypothetical protein CcI6DRAFT_03412 [Frankia sp. CcI6]EYT91622.1 hypothetical protein ThrDRAFT_02746 [Frankia casuarinae]KDA41259.1 hypothetical protein BMG523Draft_03944 [Frankia sp. BMG5.23]KEZ34731.1 hypothetical protein CEDDRAFT_03891 [Frankia sp. CeD]KFB03713.1 hypothetical protein ALLO2DRAFT_03517 [Frankia sp. Allo2]
MWTWLRGMAARRRAHSRSGSGSVDSSAWNPSGWWWCLDHGRAENPPDAPGHRRLGPYGSASDAENWRQGLDRRNEEWDEADRRWAGDR